MPKINKTDRNFLYQKIALLVGPWEITWHCLFIPSVLEHEKIWRVSRIRSAVKYLYHLLPYRCVEPHIKHFVRVSLQRNRGAPFQVTCYTARSEAILDPPAGNMARVRCPRSWGKFCSYDTTTHIHSSHQVYTKRLTLLWFVTTFSPCKITFTSLKLLVFLVSRYLYKMIPRPNFLATAQATKNEEESTE